jgi:hypothetical protein
LPLTVNHSNKPSIAGGNHEQNSMADHFTDHASDNAPTQGNLHGVAKNDQRCSSLSTISADILPLDKELQW